ncbi:MAG: hydrogenase maturation nickel metallochaperone HypA [Anaerolineales bacterium]|nr:hydrogenase maturation nickel metallochaperone HypA [Anaerolineales bacterium]
MDLTLEHAGATPGARVTTVQVVIGQLASVVDDSVQFYWDEISRGTPAEGARLQFRRVAARLHCEACGHDYAPGAEVLACPRCDSAQVRLTAGDEFYLEALEVTTDPAQEATR